MAFIFVPNADGSFTEGDKQTNPDTGVEYIYNSGAWRALGAKIEDEFDTLDERYATNEYVDDGDQSVKDYVDDAIAAIDGLPDTDLSSYLKNDGNNDLPTSANWKIRQQTSTGSNKTLIQGQDGELGLYNLKEPNESHHAATKGYVDANAGSTALRPPGLRFQYQSGNAFPASGTFNWFTSGGNQRMKVNATSQDFSWGTNTENVDVIYGEKHTFSIWLTVTSNGVTSWKLKTTGTYNRLDFHDNDVLVYISYNTPLNDLFGTNIDYYLTLSGLF